MDSALLAVLRCPRCKGALDQRVAERMRCAACGVDYPVVLGIPDLRVHGDPYLTVAEDLAAASRLAARAERASFADVLASYYAENPKVSAAQASLFTRGVVAAAARAAGVLATWRTMRTPSSAGTLLDIGAGTAPLAIAAARAGMNVVALDAGLRWLVLARARARECGVEIPLVCANAEAMPFADATFDVVAGESVLENVEDQSRTLMESYRLTRSAGALWLSVPNKHSLGPDPHTGIPAGGWLPDDVTAAIVRRRGDVPPRRRLLTRDSLRRLVRGAGYDQVATALPDIAAAQRASAPSHVRLAIDGYQLLKRTPVVGTLVALVAPTLLLTARRP